MLNAWDNNGVGKVVTLILHCIVIISCLCIRIGVSINNIVIKCYRQIPQKILCNFFQQYAPGENGQDRGIFCDWYLKHTGIFCDWFLQETLIFSDWFIK